MNDPSQLNGIVRSKKRARKQAAALPAEEKLATLDHLRERSEIQSGNRGAAEPALPRFGGRSTASGVRNEVRLGAWLAVKMLLGSSARPFWNLTGADLTAIVMQHVPPVDDVVVELADDAGAELCISAKKRGQKISLTPKNKPFAETIRDFVGRFLQWDPAKRPLSRLIWAVSPQANLMPLAKALQAHRDEMGPGGAVLAAFERRHPPSTAEGKAWLAIRSQASLEWRQQTGTEPDETTLRTFLSRTFVEEFALLDEGQPECGIVEEIARNLVVDPATAEDCWDKLQIRFAKANEYGLPVVPDQLRNWLRDNGIELQATPDFARDFEVVRSWSHRAFHELGRHGELRLGEDRIVLERQEEILALRQAAQGGSLLLTGASGIGKSGLLHHLAASWPVDQRVCLLAEHFTDRDGYGVAALPGLQHSLIDVLSHWPAGPGLIIIDAVDAVREPVQQSALHQLLEDLQQNLSGWKIVASVREFDLKCSRRIREAIPGKSVPGYGSGEFSGVAHFYLSGLADSDLEAIATWKPELNDLLASARQKEGSGHLLRSPFYLSIALGLLSYPDVTPALLSDWNSPALLLRHFWERRVPRSDRDVLRRITEEMVKQLSTSVSDEALPCDAASAEAIERLRSGGVLASPRLLAGAIVAEGRLQFSHHLLLDYAVAKHAVPHGKDQIIAFLKDTPAFSVFWRVGLNFALEEHWDADVDRTAFWDLAKAFFARPGLRMVARVVAPAVAARRVRTQDDLQPLLKAVLEHPENGSPPCRLLLHLSLALQDLNPAVIRESVSAWTWLSAQLGALLAEQDTGLRAPTAIILERLAKEYPEGFREEEIVRKWNAAARSLLAEWVSHPPGERLGFPGRMAIELVCKTFQAAPNESAVLLRRLLSPERVEALPFGELDTFANELGQIGVMATDLVIDFFETVFSRVEESDDFIQTGTPLLGLSFRKSDIWNGVQTSLGDFYLQLGDAQPDLLTRLVCVVWNGVFHGAGRRRRATRCGEIALAGKIVPLYEDGTGITGASLEDEERRILHHFQEQLRSWSAGEQADALQTVLDVVVEHNRTALLWSVLLEQAAEFPALLGERLLPFAESAFCLTHGDYREGARLLFEALHRTGDEERRAWLEHVVFHLAAELPRGESEADDDFAQRVRRWQGRILGSLDRDRLVLPQVGSLYEELAAADQLRMAFHSRPIGPYHLRSSVSSRVQDEASQPGEATRLELDALEERLKPFLAEGDAFDLELVERDWTTVEVCELAVLREQESRPQFARELWGKLVEAAANVVHQADWAPECERWRDLRRILLLAASDPVPSQDSAEENASEDWPDPSPRGDAANSLSCLVYRLGVADEEVTNALRALRSDGNRAVRFNFARGIPWLHRDASALFWELTDATIDEEPSIAVLDGMVLSLEQILSIDPDNAMPRLVRIREITEELASPTNAIFQKLTAAFLFHYLRTGAKNAWSQVQQLVEHCDEERAAHALGRLPGQCRMGGWLIGDQPDDPKPRRTWRFFELLLQSAQARRNDLHRTEESNPAFRRLSQLADSIAGQLYFGSGAHASTSKTSDGTTLTHRQLSQFWNDAKPVLELLSREAHPHTAARTVDTLCHLMPCDPEAAFQLALRCVTRSCESGNLHHDRLARDGVLRMIRTALSDHSQIFHRGDGHASACFNPLLDVIDRFLEADCSKTRSLVAELDSLYR